MDKARENNRDSEGRLQNPLEDQSKPIDYCKAVERG